MKPIENIFGFDCGTCEYNRYCYGGNMGNQFRYCEKSAEKIQNLDNLEQENKQLKDNWNKLKEWVNKHYDYYMNEEDYIGGRLCFIDMKNKMQELEQGSDSNE